MVRFSRFSATFLAALSPASIWPDGDLGAGLLCVLTCIHLRVTTDICLVYYKL